VKQLIADHAQTFASRPRTPSECVAPTTRAPGFACWISCGVVAGEATVRCCLVSRASRATDSRHATGRSRARGSRRGMDRRSGRERHHATARAPSILHRNAPAWGEAAATGRDVESPSADRPVRKGAQAPMHCPPSTRRQVPVM
jgi:hypothetical protein